MDHLQVRSQLNMAGKRASAAFSIGGLSTEKWLRKQSTKRSVSMA
jgi:hypothetical protein